MLRLVTLFLYFPTVFQTFQRAPATSIFPLRLLSMQLPCSCHLSYLIKLMFKVPSMACPIKYLIAFSALSCSSAPAPPLPAALEIGQNSFVVAAQYGTPISYQHQGDYLQLNYGSNAADCRLIVLVDQRQRVVGWASSGTSCPIR